MLAKRLILIAAVLSLASVACGVTINVPEVDLVTGPTITKDIIIESLETDETTKVELNFAMGELILNPGASALVEGVATYNIQKLEPEVKTSDKGVSINTKADNIPIEFTTIPNVENAKNRWDLQLGEDTMDLVIHSDVYEGDLELGGLALESLAISGGAADLKVNFSEVNPVEMSAFTIESGASDIELSGLANANFAYMSFDTGLGDFKLDFSGELQQDAVVNITAELSDLVIIVPEGTNVQLNLDAELADIDTSGEWDQSGNRYTMDGDGPTLIINVDIGIGDLSLRN
ncbi:MAG: hypothetical protein DWQ07_10475 [Chloroflexi bacterium]|nr:MAG: hypothetical protein DWQ07_10475 [Chloroflexota bacterium]MBL1192863.1 hypothetical protein [Chloroflexota bacterium]NOH10156.1 hypothetical protein [Chloroflexota bacterium]